MIEQHISNIENESVNLSLSTMVAITNALSIDCNSLLGVTLTEAQKEIKCEGLTAPLAAMSEQNLSLCIEISHLEASAG